jgi:hypothetical protein
MKHIKKISDIFKKNKDFIGWYLDFICHDKPQEYFAETYFFENMSGVYEFVMPIVNKLKIENKKFQIFISKRVEDEGTDGIWLLFDNIDNIPAGYPIKRIIIPEEFYNRKWKDNEISILEFENYFNSKEYKEYKFNKDINKYNL